MGEEEKNDPPPPSLSKPDAGPPPPSLNKPDPTPQMPPAGGKSGPPVIQDKDERVGEPEEDELAHRAIAPLNPRLIAAIIDGLVAIGLYFVAIMVLPGMLERLAWVLWGGYLVTRDSLPFLKGQSVGKTAMKLKVQKNDGSSMLQDWQTAIVRNIPLIIPFFGLIEAIVLFSRDSKPERGLRLGDEWAKTKVVVWRPEEEQEASEESSG
ncbi:RDD family protein [Haloferula sp.]|uniref:RDD family protein n=1 Tax=Haloferula sp. TaxID=2497595 RepID=UPI00329CB108